MYIWKNAAVKKTVNMISGKIEVELWGETYSRHIST